MYFLNETRDEIIIIGFNLYYVIFNLFMKKILLLFILIILLSNLVTAQSVNLQYDTSSVQAKYAEKMLHQALLEKGYSIQKNKSDYSISIRINSQNLKPEAYILRPEKNKITITGGDGTGVIYGSLSLAEDLRNGISLSNIHERSESPNLSFRAIKFDLPWDTYRHSYALYQHQETCKDLKFWEAFLDMMAENRFNALTLWNLHPYTFLIKPKNFPEASPWNDNEMKEWKKLFHGIFRMAKERGIDTYIMPFNIFVTPEFSKAHNVEMFNLDHFHFVNADTSEIIKQYTREMRYTNA